MSEVPNPTRLVRQWVEKAEHDIVAAEHLLMLGETLSLTDYAVHARYFVDDEPITREEAGEAVAVARGVREAVRARLPREALEI